MEGFAIASPHVRKGIRTWNPANFSFWHQESGKFLPVKSRIQDFGIRNLAQGIQNPVNDYNPNPSSTDNDLESSIWNSEFMAWNPEFKTVLHPLTWVDSVKSWVQELICKEAIKW